MRNILIRGGTPLSGAVRVHGAKNSLLPVLAASLMAQGETVLEDCPALADVTTMLDILRELGCQCRFENREIHICADGMDSWRLKDDLVSRLRSSIFMLGPLLARFGRAELGYPGGCDIGLRPIDLHLHGLRALGARIEEGGGLIRCRCGILTGNEVFLDYPSVGATENVMMAAALAQGATIIHHAAKEPEIVDLQNFLNAMGACIRGAGTPQIIIHGRETLHAVRYRVIPDRIVTGTFLLAAAITGGDVTVENAVPEHVAMLTDKLADCGCEITRENGLRLRTPHGLRAAKRIETMPYPGFPTDLQSPMMALQTVAEGTCILVENVFENRFRLAGELAKMGADITLHGRTAIIRGVDRLHGTSVTAHDLRGGAALLLAGLNADGVTVVHDEDRISRGYWKIEESLCSLHADIRVEEEQ